MNSSAIPAPAPGHRWFVPLLGLLLVAALLPYAYGCLFSTFAPYDDEGFILISIRSFIAQGGLYDRIYSIYGPFFYAYQWLLHAVLELPVTHDVNRLTTLVEWMSIALLLAATARRLTDNWPVTILVFFYVFLPLGSLSFQPGHPQGLCLLLLAALLAAAAGKRSAEWSPWRAAAMGAIVVAIGLSKINLGLFAAMAYLLTLLRRGAGRHWQRRGFWAVGLLCLAMVPALMHRHLATAWGQAYLLSAASAIGLAIAAADALRGPEPRGAPALWGGFVSGAGAVFVATLAFALARGSTPAGLWQGIVAEPLRHGAGFVIPPPLSGLNAWSAAASVVLYTLKRIFDGRLTGGLVVAAKTALALLVLAPLPGTPPLLMVATPWVWLVAVNGPSGSAPQPKSGRLLLALTAATQSLQAYPVAGTQYAWATLFLVPVAGICLSDVLSLCGHRLARSGLVLPSSLAWRGLLSVLLFFGLCRHHAIQPFALPADYRQKVALQLPGAGRLHLPISVAGRYHWLTANLARYADVFASMPGLNSLYLWTRSEPPTGWNVTTWMTKLDAARQGEIVAALRHATRPCIVEAPAVLAFWLQGRAMPPSPLAHAIQRDYVPAFARDGYVFRVRKTRDATQMDEYLLAAPRTFNGVLAEALACPAGSVSAEGDLTVTAEMATRSGGILLGLQQSDSLRPVGWAVPLLFVDSAGRLRGGVPLSLSGPMTSRTVVNDETRHRVSLVLTHDAQWLYLDGQLQDHQQFSHRRPPLPPHGLIGAVVGRVITADPMGTQSFKGRIGPVTLHTVALSADDIRARHAGDQL